MENETKKCPECLAEIPKKARKCSHCGSKTAPKTRPIVWILLLGAIGVVMASAMSVENTTPPDPCDISYLKANRFVKDTLKSPSTAEFPSRSEYSISNLGNSECMVSSYVDSQNSFGAVVRSHWTATVKDNAGNWTLEEMTFDGEQVYP